jgi:hypothetical protein
MQKGAPGNGWPLYPSEWKIAIRRIPAVLAGQEGAAP